MADVKIALLPTGMTFSRNTKAPLEDNRIFDTLALAQAYVDNVDQTAHAGLTISVVADSFAANNGLYYVERVADADNAKGLLVKLGSDSAADIAAVQADVATLKTTVGDATSGLVADVTKNAADVQANAEEIAKKADVFTVGNGLVVTDNKINVVVSAAEGNSLSVDENGLYVSVPTITVPEYTLETVATPDAAYTSQYEFKKDGVVLNTINIPKDQFLKEASYDDAANKLIFVFTTAAGETTTEVDVNDLVDTYTAGSYITITDASISVDYEALKSQINTDLVNPVAVAVNGIDTRLGAAETAVTDHTSKIGVLETAKGDHETRIKTLEDVNHPTLDQVTTLETNYNTLNTNVTNLQASVTEIKVKDVDSTASHGVSLKLDAAGKVGVTVDIDTIADAVIEKHVVSISAADIALSENIGTEENPDRYTTSDSVQGVLAGLNARIESIDADIQSALDGGVTGIEAMNGIVVDATTATKPKVGIKIATGSALSATANGLDLVWEELV